MNRVYLEKIILLWSTEIPTSASSTDPSSTSAMHLSSVFLFRSLSQVVVLHFLYRRVLTEDACDLSICIDLASDVRKVQSLRRRVYRDFLILEAVELRVGYEQLVLTFFGQNLVEGDIVGKGDLLRQNYLEVAVHEAQVA